MPTIGQNFTIDWTEGREEKYQEYREVAGELGKSKSTAVDNIMKALDIATERLREIKKERDKVSKTVDKI